jgi:NADPH:quinone reductase-like Zn-dependent oxidoreductase
MRSVVWPSIGISEIVEQDEPSAGPDDVVIDVSISVLSPGTERALLLGLPTTAAEFPQFPGYMAAGSVRRARSMAAGTRVAVRRAGHRSVAVVPALFVRAVPEHVPLVDAAVWQLALTAMYGPSHSASTVPENPSLLSARAYSVSSPAGWQLLAVHRGCGQSPARRPRLGELERSR